MKVEPLVHADGRVVCERLGIADTAFARVRGLLGRSELEHGEGILLAPASSIHTFFMRFAIDAVFLGADSEVLKIADALPPWRAAGCRGAKAVIELGAGECARLGIRAGDRLAIGPR